MVAAPGAPRRPLIRYDVQLPGNANMNIVFRPAVSVSADGSTFAFVGTKAGIDRIHVRARTEFLLVRPVRDAQARDTARVVLNWDADLSPRLPLMHDIIPPYLIGGIQVRILFRC